MAWREGITCWKLSSWPASDQAAWIRNTAPRDPFDDLCDTPNYGASLRPASRDKAARGYGRWLCFLHSRGWLDPEVPALARVTHGRLRSYFRDLRASGNADFTVIGRFDELARALRILTPGQDASWVRRPFGQSVYAALPKTQRTLIVPDSGVLFAWAISLMDAARQPKMSRAQNTTYRDGLLLAMLACRGRRLRSMALLRAGHELIREGGGFRVELAADQVKTGKPDRFDLPHRLTPHVCHYLEVVRPALLGDHTHSALWINPRGGPLSEKAFQHVVCNRTRARFGQAFGPHRFRHAIATTATLHDPGHPGVAAGLLGISAGVLEQHYNRAGQSRAAMAYDALIEKRKHETRYVLTKPH